MADLEPATALAPPAAVAAGAAEPGAGQSSSGPPVSRLPDANMPAMPGAPLSAPTPEPAPVEGVTPIRARLLGMAEGESRAAQRQAALQRDFANRGEVLATAVPAKYLELVAQLRAAVRAYNSQLVELPESPLQPLKWFETPNVTLKDPTGGDGMRVRVSRVNSYFDLLLRMVHRSGKSDIPLIEGYGSIGREQIRTETLMRIEGWVEGGQTTFRMSLDFKRIAIPLDEIADRIVMAVASHDYTLLSRTFGPPKRRSNDDEEEAG